jgi:phenylacetic acid degradation protein paaN
VNRPRSYGGQRLGPVVRAPTGRGLTGDDAYHGPVTRSEDLFERHRVTLDRTLEVIHSREYWSPYPEIPSGSIYGETANDDGRAAFEGRRGTLFALDQPGRRGEVGGERSPYGFELDVRYPQSDPDALIQSQLAAMPGWRDAGVDARAGVCLDILDRLNRRSFEMAYAVMHTTGQPFVMAFQAGGPHAQDRGLEGVAYAFAEQTRHVAEAYWEKPQGKRDPLRLEKRFTIVPRGISLVVGCNTFPTWNSYAGLFASLASGNPALIKPHHRAILPMAITVAVAREALADAGFDPNLVCLAVAPAEEHLASTLATRPEVRVIDYTGSTAYGEWLEANARQAAVFTEKAGVNSIVIDSTDDLGAMARNIAFSLSLYSGQMCTAPQNLLVPREGIVVGGERVPLADVEAAIAGAIDELLADASKAVEVVGAIVNDDVLRRTEEANRLGRTILATRPIDHPQFPDAVIRTPALIGVDAADTNSEGVYSREWFGPVAFVVATDSTEHSLELFRRLGRSCGSITAGVYSTSEDVLRDAESAALDVGVALSCNLVGNIWVNQSAAFSDFHATGANPAANASLTDGAFVASRFRIVESRRPA